MNAAKHIAMPMMRFLFAVCLVLIFSRCTAQEEKRNAKTVVCFVYHRFGDTRYPSTNITVKDFEAHLRFLAEKKYNVLTLTDALAYLKSDSPAEKTAVLTIDDGYKTFFERGLPLLKKYKMPATLFINTESVGGSDLMTWQQLKDAMTAGVEIGNHTHSHDYFLNKDESTRYTAFENEIEQSQQIIKENLGIVPALFSYPYGEYDERMRDVVKKHGFVAAVAQKSGVFYSGTDLFQIPRFPMSEAYSAISKFIEKAGMKAIPVLSVSPDRTVLKPGENRPSLSVTFDTRAINIKQLKCYIQGSDCEMKFSDQTENEVTVTIQAKQAITSRRRTIYTITAPGIKGDWYWYSHLWINPKTK